MQDRVIFHSDLNNFFASVECTLNPSLKNYAVAVAGNPEKRTGIILAKNYLAKVFGVKTGDVIWEAKQKCPTLICVAPHYEKYNEISEKVRKIYYEYTDLVEPFGIDECWLDVTGSLKLFNCTAVELAKKIQDRIYDELGLSVSIGISFSKTLAKLGSDMKKPKGLTVIDRDNHIDIIKKLKIEDMIMIGRHTAKKLHDMNIYTLFDLYNMDKKILRHRFGVVGTYMHNAVAGIDDNKLITPKEEYIKSVGNGATSPKDMTTMEQIKEFLHNLSEKISSRLRHHGFMAKTIHVDIKFADFTHLSAQDSKPCYFSNEHDLYEYSLEIFNSLVGEKFSPIRAIRICTSNLITRDEQIQSNLFANTKKENLCKAIDKIKEKFGKNAITRVSDEDY
ncbi:MAG: DNA polymerase IV [Clostridia bacterium]|nr:DNA polymerase IV [Clostridia bacterium]